MVVLTSMKLLGGTDDSISTGDSSLEGCLVDTELHQSLGNDRG